MEFPRAQAVRALGRVLGDGRDLDEVLAGEAAALDPGARNWLHEITAGTLRWKGRLDLALGSLSEKKKPTGWLKRVLEVAAYQLIAQDQSPAPAVVSETVDLVRREEGKAPSSFANAVLRKLAEQGRDWRNAARPATASLEEQALWASLPPWMWKRLCKQQGEAWAEKFAVAMLDRPRVWVREKTGERLLPPDSPRVTELPGFREGQFFVQDVASQRLIQDFSSHIQKPGRALDLCAAPGGKSFGLEWSGWDVVATDSNPTRLGLMRENAARLRSKVKIIDYAEAAAHGPYDLVWVDAPCTGSGVLRRHPEIRWQRTEADLASLVTLQGELLQQASALVAPGGHLVYSACSVLGEEGANQRGHFLKNPDFKLAAEKLITPFEEMPSDGFYGALFSRT